MGHDNIIRRPDLMGNGSAAAPLSANGNPHAGHREKLKNRFLLGDFDRFEDHTALELLLFYALPQRDTNPLAHRLISRFGSLRGVLDAPVEELCQMDGISLHTATLLKLIPALCRRYRIAEVQSEDEVYDSVSKLGQYVTSLYIGATAETVYLLLLDNRFRLLDTVRLHEGSVNSVQISSRRIVETAMSRRAAMVVLAHNHPGGIPVPSTEDLSTTEVISSALSMMDIRFLEHIVVAGEQFAPVMLRGRTALAQRDNFWQTFYDRY